MQRPAALGCIQLLCSTLYLEKMVIEEKARIESFYIDVHAKFSLSHDLTSVRSLAGKVRRI